MLVEHQIHDAQRTLAMLDCKARPRRMMERDIIVVWGLYRGWTDRLTGKTARAHPMTISRRRESSPLFNALERDSVIIFDPNEELDKGRPEFGGGGDGGGSNSP